MENVNKQLLDALEKIGGMTMSMYANAGEAMRDAKRIAYEAIAAAEQAQQSEQQSEEAAYIKWMCETFPTVYDPPLARLWIEKKHVSFLAWMESAKRLLAQQQAEPVARDVLMAALDDLDNEVVNNHGIGMPFELRKKIADRYAAQPPAVAVPGATDDDLEEMAKRLGMRWDGDFWAIEDADFHPFMRAMLAAMEQPK